MFFFLLEEVFLIFKIDILSVVLTLFHRGTGFDLPHMQYDLFTQNVLEGLERCLSN